MTPSDELAVRALVARYADAVNRADPDEWAATWSATGEWHIGGQHLVGRDAIVAFWRSAMAGFEAVTQLVAQGRVGASSAGADGRWTIWEIGRKAGRGSLVVGCYQDRYVRHDGEWCFAERRFTATYRGEVPAGEFFPFPAAH
jgi:hypothetical protein